MSKNSSPPPPDYAGAAEATAAGDLEAARYQTMANRPNSYYPGGQREWTQGQETFDQGGYDQAMQEWFKNNPGQAPSAAGGGAAAGITGPGGYPQQPSISGGGMASGVYGGSSHPEDEAGFMMTPGVRRQRSPAPQAQAGAPTPASGGMPTRDDFTAWNPDKWTERVTLSPEGQKAFETGERVQTGLAGLAETGVGQMQDIFGTPFEIAGEVPGYQGATGDMPSYGGPGGQMPGFRGPEGAMPTYGQHRQGVVDAMMGRVNTDISREKESKASQLAAQGIPVGSEAFNRAMEASDRKQTDARQQAEIAAEQMAGMGYSSALAGRGMESAESMNDFMTAMQARGMSAEEARDAYRSQMEGRGMSNQEAMADYTTGLDTRRQGIQEALLQRQTPINEMSAFRTGSQVGTPQFQPFGQQQFTGGADYLGAETARGQYDLGRSNQDIAQGNALMGGLFDLGTAGIGAKWSDRRLKKNIKRLGTSLMGFPVYAFDYIWGGGKQVGVMAQDVIKVLPGAVHTSKEGYMSVDYGMIR